MDRRFVTVLATSLIFALVVSGLFYQVVAGSSKSSKQRNQDTRDLVTAAHALGVGVVLKRADLTLVRVTASQFPNGGFSKIEEAVGRPVVLSILQDEPIREGRLAARGAGSGLAPTIPDGMRAVAVRVNEVVGVAGFVLPGMRVDVLVTGRPANQDETMTKTILQDILVLSAGQTIEPDARGQAINAPVVTLLVTPEQAEALTLASEDRIQLVLRNGGDRGAGKTPGRDMTDLFGKPRAPNAAVAVPPRRAPAPVAAATPAPTPRTTDDVVIFRGAQKAVEQVAIQKPD
jgi:pilus assembly protein CpaB